jgi:transcriptional regulator with XRE-family HTH domain
MPRITLAQALKRRKISKRQFAKRLGCHYATVFQFFRPGYNPTFKMMCRWAKALDVRVRDLYKE